MIQTRRGAHVLPGRSMTHFVISVSVVVRWQERCAFSTTFFLQDSDGGPNQAKAYSYRYNWQGKIKARRCVSNTAGVQREAGSGSASCIGGS